MAICCFWPLVTNSSFAQSWTPNCAPNKYWNRVISSADGNRLAAFSSTQIYTSTNSGTSWASNNLPAGALSCVDAATSADGSVLVVGDLCGGIYTSTNSGKTWTTNNVPFGTWYAVASSADGRKLVALSWFGNLFYISTNAGYTWTSSSPPCTNYFNGCAMASSADGRKLAAAVTIQPAYPSYINQGWIYTSTNFGVTWQITSAPNTNWCSVASSADGNKLIAAAYDSMQIYSQSAVFMSTNSGATWTALNMPGPLWGRIAIACSTNGNNLIVAPGNFPGCIYTSTDSGATWITNNAPQTYWSSVASSADGCKLAAVTYPGLIYTWQYRPIIHLSSSSANQSIFWASSPFAVGYELQQNSDLASTNWMTAGLPVNDDGTNMRVSISPLIRNTYFRLFHP